MPTSPRDLTGRTGGMIRINHPLWPRTFLADVGIRPYAGGRFCHATWPGRFGEKLYALSLVISRYRFRYCQAEFSQDTFLSMSRWTISSQQ